ncbi:tetratricopeptide repeat protein [Chishuiella sp.]|uniref:tetratricopeptide repeat protein n=1 Tax=Chishuiella sp. TaxID=1969467 RepID=UPI0028B0DD0D|nr:tetratricopeptide repeat protein [Chishuiella sp.]
MMTRIEYLVAHPYDIEKSDIPLLKKEVEKYPYFYTLRALLLYGLKKENHPSFEDYLNKTSIHSSNRVDLYHYINSEQIIKKIDEEEITNPILTHENDALEYTMLETEIETISANDFAETTDIQTEINNEIISQENIDLINSENDNFQNTIVESENSTFEEEEVSINEVKTIANNVDVIELDTEINNIVEEHISQETSSKNTSTSETTFSFSDWLKKFPSQGKDEKLIEQEQEIKEREIKYKLIDDFLEKNPKIIPNKKTDIIASQVTSNFVQNSEEYSDLMTETLAQIYIEQKKFDKAIKAYKILILKYPEKNGLFANRIKEIENLKNYK